MDAVARPESKLSFGDLHHELAPDAEEELVPTVLHRPSSAAGPGRDRHQVRVEVRIT